MEMSLHGIDLVEPSIDALIEEGIRNEGFKYANALYARSRQLINPDFGFPDIEDCTYHTST